MGIWHMDDSLNLPTNGNLRQVASKNSSNLPGVAARMEGFFRSPASCCCLEPPP